MIATPGYKPFLYMDGTQINRCLALDLLQRLKPVLAPMQNTLEADYASQGERKAVKLIRFIDPHYQEQFRLPDGGHIVITYQDGERRVAECKSLGEMHVAVDGECYHICQFAEVMQRCGAAFAPQIAPQIVQGYHVVMSRPERDKIIFMGHKPGAEPPWATWQADRDNPAKRQQVASAVPQRQYPCRHKEGF